MNDRTDRGPRAIGVVVGRALASAASLPLLLPLLMSCTGAAASVSADPAPFERGGSSARDPLPAPPLGAEVGHFDLVGVTADDWVILREARAEGTVVRAVSLDGAPPVEIDTRSDAAVIRRRVVFSLAGSRLTAWSAASGAHVVSTAAPRLDEAVAASETGAKVVWVEALGEPAGGLAMRVADVDGTAPTVAIAALDGSCRPRSVARGDKVLVDVCDPSRSVATLQVIDTARGVGTPLLDSVSSWSVDDAGANVVAVVKSASGRFEAKWLSTSGAGPVLDVGPTDGAVIGILGDGSAVVYADRGVRIWRRATRTSTATGAVGRLGPIAPDGARFVYADLYGRGVGATDGRSPMPLPLVTGDTLNADAFTADGDAVVYLADPDASSSPVTGAPAVASVTTGARRILGPAGARVDRLVPTRGAQLVFLARGTAAAVGDLYVVDAVDAASGDGARVAERVSDFAVDDERTRVVWLEPGDAPRVHVATLR